MVGSLTRNAAAIWSVVRPQTARRVSATCASGAQRGVAAGEGQAQQLIVGLPVRSPASAALPGSGRPRPGRPGTRGSVTASSASLRRTDLVAAEPVEGLAAGGGGQPAAGVGGDPVARPVLDRLDERVLHRVLGQADVAGARGQGGPDPGRLLLVGALKRLRCRVHGPSLPRRAPWPRGCDNERAIGCGCHNHGRWRVGGRRGYQRRGANLCSAA